MEAILIPLAKGLFGLIGASSLFFMSVKRDIEIQLEEMELKQDELLEVQPLQAQPELKFEVVPAQPKK